MVEQLPLEILAPWVRTVDPAASVVHCAIPDVVQARLRKRSFTEERDDDRIAPGHAVFRLVPTHSAEVGAELTDEQLVEREFGNSNWQKRVQRAMEERRLVQDKRNWSEGQTTVANQRSSRDEFFSVRVDNLPEGFEPYLVELLLQDYGCNYYAKVVIPRDENEQYKRFGFIKFERLRYALKFLEDCRRMKVQNLVLNIGLVI
jgi:hypothetical protein